MPAKTPYDEEYQMLMSLPMEDKLANRGEIAARIGDLRRQQAAYLRARADLAPVLEAARGLLAASRAVGVLGATEIAEHEARLEDLLAAVGEPLDAMKETT